MRAVREGRFPPCRQRGCFAEDPQHRLCSQPSPYVHSGGKLMPLVSDLLLAPTKFVRDKMVDSAGIASGRGVAALSARSERVAHCAFHRCPDSLLRTLIRREGCDRPRARHALIPTSV